jgi:hypothetical protein
MKEHEFGKKYKQHWSIQVPFEIGQYLQHLQDQVLQ